MGLALIAVGVLPAQAQETLCARVKIEIKQELTLERQGFDAEMNISNGLDSESITDVKVVVNVTDEAGTPVAISSDPANTSAKFFIRVSGKQNITDVDGAGVVAPSTTASVNWLLIPAPGAAADNPLGKKYLVGARLTYKFQGEEQAVDVSPDVITVKPLPLLTLDYFLTQYVEADDPLTPEIEPVVPFTLGVRVKNTGLATAKNLKIDSAQPKIVENNQGLLINFKLTGSYVNDAPVQNTLLINFGDVAAGKSKMGRWLMETTLAGKFTEFTAKFTHADELGGALTSILQATNAHFLIGNVRVDLPGRDYVLDYLAEDPDGIRVYESDGADNDVTNRTGDSVFTAGTNAAGNASYRLEFPATAGFIYVKLPDPYDGAKVLGTVMRSDGKRMLPENAWLSRTRNKDTKKWEYWINFFDQNTTGLYDTEFQAPPPEKLAPQLQFIADHTVVEEKQVSYLVEASSPAGLPVTLSAAPLPAGAKFYMLPKDPDAPTLTRAIFDWTPPKGTAGNYLIVYTASDGTQSNSRSATITVTSNVAPPGPITPTIDSPLSGAQVTALKPVLGVMTSENTLDPTTQVEFEVYADEAMTELVESGLVNEAAPLPGQGAGTVNQPTTWQMSVDLIDNTRYWWRARTFDGATLYSTWVNGQFFVNLYNDPPESFNLTSPAPNAEVGEVQPLLTWTNSSDRDGDAVTYGVTVYRDAALTDVVTTASGIAAGESGSTSWLVDMALNNHDTYYWKVIATDALSAETASMARPFVVNTGNTAPTAPVILSPAVGGQSPVTATTLTIQNGTDAEQDLITYVFEIDTVDTFDSADRRGSGQVIQGGGDTTAWTVTDLVENKHYYWRVKAQDGRAESGWVVGNFLMNAANDAPPVPTVKNPGDGAWSPSLQPTLEVNPELDPEGDLVHHEFEVYADAGLTQLVTSGAAADGAFVVPVALTDRATHWWRVRAVDSFGAASLWSPAAKLYVSTGPYLDPTIQVTSPSTPMVPETVTLPDGTTRKQVTIRWEGNDPNIDPNVGLYYGTTAGSYVGDTIVEGLHQNAGTQTGSYTWDVTGLAAGAYYVYGAIWDARGVGRAYAPGAVVIPTSPQAGSIIVKAGTGLWTSEAGVKTTFRVRLATQPKANVVVPISSTNAHAGIASPASLTFTPTNWNVLQTVTVKGQDDCLRGPAKAYKVLVGKAITVDPDYIGLSGTPVSIINKDNADKIGTTNNPLIGICDISVVSARKVSATRWDYRLRGQLTNGGPDAAAVTALLTKLPFTGKIIENTLIYGAVAKGETVKTTDTVTIRTSTQLQPDALLGLFRWTVNVQLQE